MALRLARSRANGTRTILWACGFGPQSNQVWFRR